MATPNYGFEKRQRELAKRQKKEDKLRAKAERKSGTGGDHPPEDDMPESDAGSPAESESQPTGTSANP